jgi:hypothetical protein
MSVKRNKFFLCFVTLLYSSLIINDQILPPNPRDDIANILRNVLSVLLCPAGTAAMAFQQDNHNRAKNKE